MCLGQAIPAPRAEEACRPQGLLDAPRAPEAWRLQHTFLLHSFTSVFPLKDVSLSSFPTLPRMKPNLHSWFSGISNMENWWKEGCNRSTPFTSARRTGSRRLYMDVYRLKKPWGLLNSLIKSPQVLVEVNDSKHHFCDCCFLLKQMWNAKCYQVFF